MKQQDYLKGNVMHFPKIFKSTKCSLTCLCILVQQLIVCLLHASTQGQGGEDVRLREINHLKDWSSTFLAETCAFILCLTHSTYRKKIYYILDVTQCNKMYFIENEGGKTIPVGEVLASCISTLTSRRMNLFTQSTYSSAASSHFYNRLK